MREVPKATAKRLPLYYRYLRMFKNMGKETVSSQELSEALKVDAATIRRDFSHFGTLGKRGYGYNVDDLLEFFSQELYQGELTRVGVIGVGSLGTALVKYNFKRDELVEIGAAFDINPDVYGQTINNVPVYPMTQLTDRFQELEMNIAVLTVPEDQAQAVVEPLLKAGIKGILNLTPVRLDVPSDVHVQNVDLSNELETLIYFVNNG